MRAPRVLVTALLAAGALLWVLPASAQSTWSVVSSPNVPGSNFNELDGTAATGPADAWAVGFSRVTTPFRATVEHWNGKTWSLVATAPTPSSSDTRLHGVAALTASNVWAVGSRTNGTTAGSLIEHWNGTAWSIVPSPANEPAGSELHAISAISSTDVWAVGWGRGSTFFATLIEHWDGSRWTVVSGAALPIAQDRLLGVAGSSSSDVWAVGVEGRHSTPVIEHWNGSAWSQVAQPVNGYDSNLTSLAVIASNDVWAVGSQNLSQTVTEHWDGKTWSLVPSPFPTANNAQNTLTGVAAFGTNDVWAVGSTLSSFTVNQTLTEHWNGTAWSIVASPNPSPNDALAAVAGTGAGQPLWAVGNQIPSSQYQNLIVVATA